MTQTAKHTPGPWEAIAVERKYHDEDGQIITVATVMAGVHLAVARCHKLEDAQFIAAALDMAEALKELISTVEMFRENVYRRGDGTASNECVNMLSANTLVARAALTKAGIN